MAKSAVGRLTTSSALDEVPDTLRTRSNVRFVPQSERDKVVLGQLRPSPLVRWCNEQKISDLVERASHVVAGAQCWLHQRCRRGRGIMTATRPWRCVAGPCSDRAMASPTRSWCSRTTSPKSCGPRRTDALADGRHCAALRSRNIRWVIGLTLSAFSTRSKANRRCFLRPNAYLPFEFNNVTRNRY
jgi:hypothetical protein